MANVSFLEAEMGVFSVDSSILKGAAGSSSLPGFSGFMLDGCTHKGRQAATCCLAFFGFGSSLQTCLQ